MKLLKKNFRTPLYGLTFTVIVYSSPKKLDKFFKKKDIYLEFNHRKYDGFVYTLNNHHYCCFYASSKQYPTPGIIAHEAKHLVNKIFIDVDQLLDRHNDEAECYLLGWLVNRIHEVNSKFVR
jgi:hypothetical protein